MVYSIIWVWLIQSVEGVKRKKRLKSSEEDRIVFPDYFWTWAATLTLLMVSSLLACPASFEVTNPDDYISQFLTINLSLCLSVSLSLSLSLHILLVLFLWNILTNVETMKELGIARFMVTVMRLKDQKQYGQFSCNVVHIMIYNTPLLYYFC